MLSLATYVRPPDDRRLTCRDERKTHRSSLYVILSERSESKDLRTYGIFAVKSVRRSFDSGLRPPLRMTDIWCIDSFMTMTEVSGQQKRGRKNPTQHRYHITISFSSQRENDLTGAKSVPCTKTDVCIWETFRLEKLENSCYLIVTKRRYLNSRTSGGLPKAKVNKGNQSDFKSK